MLYIHHKNLGFRLHPILTLVNIRNNDNVKIHSVGYASKADTYRIIAQKSQFMLKESTREQRFAGLCSNLYYL